MLKFPKIFECKPPKAYERLLTSCVKQGVSEQFGKIQFFIVDSVLAGPVIGGSEMESKIVLMMGSYEYLL